ncbi:ABC transporter ATP-binding protein [Deinococcus gobiensis]|uniref:Oligopeptide/dipeptide ABC transporter, ATPase subunit n=1 Tax=Deinococcus gobiensis (strain DSM 21396 / JCM 16679 / CGMCC 1.7299 / I-0) TaxID=745776 RepID=H8GVQ9_DEIGI|nr:ABC transporter ATP-binding protein [Deinococcus gobiensis]AFD25621.1 oligopeptide/dipeptide ABC transporter, ATPase subunit [Deinococcus gobiensis I-0]
MTHQNDVLLAVNNLKTYFSTDDGVVKSVDGVTFHIKKGETLAVVGESGSGKSVTSLSVMRLIPMPPGKIVDGEILFTGKDGTQKNLVTLSEAEMRKIRGNDISMIFQEPMTSLNPVYTVGDQIAEAVMLHQNKNRKDAMGVATDMLRFVGIPAPEKRVHEYPHQMSGGMRQRVMIAMALSCNPALLIADEPTTALDVTIQAQILDLMRKLQTDIGMSILFITHNLGVVAEMADRVVVMYGGRVVEEGDVVEIFKAPRHPYTMGLLNSIPRPGGEHEYVPGQPKKRLEAIPGNVPNPLNLPPGCSFEPRCKFAVPECSQAVPPLEDTGGGHTARCIRWREFDSVQQEVSA